jgi:hypothetical protein
MLMTRLLVLMYRSERGFLCWGNSLTSHADVANKIPCYGVKYGSRHADFGLRS